MSDRDGFFDFAGDDRSERLRALGWLEFGILVDGTRLWQAPDTSTMTEAEAFAFLERQEGTARTSGGFQTAIDPSSQDDAS